MKLFGPLSRTLAAAGLVAEEEATSEAIHAAAHPGRARAHEPAEGEA